MISNSWTKGLAVCALLLCAALAVSACGGGTSTASQGEIAAAEKHARRVKAEKEKERSLERKLSKLERENKLAKKRRREKAKQELKEREDAHVTSSESTLEPAPETAPSGTDCGGGVTAGPETSCGFAINVAAEYESQIGSGSGSIEAYSEANEQVYPMFCSAAPHECSGAISATVFFP